MALENANAPTKIVEAEGKKYLVKTRSPMAAEALIVKALTALNMPDITGILELLGSEDPSDGRAIGLAIFGFLRGADPEALTAVLADTLLDVKLILPDNTNRSLLSTDVTKVSTLAKLRMAWFELNIS